VAGSGSMEVRGRAAKIILLTASLVILFFSFYRFGVVITKHLGTKYDLATESISLATIRSLQQGKAIYADHFFRDLPFIITIYNPLYLYITSLMPQSEDNPFLTGRVVSLMATLLALILLFLPGYSWKWPKVWIVSFMAISWVLLHPIFLQSAVYMHPDMLAMSLSALAVVSIESPRSRLRVVIAALLAFLGFAAKQNYLSATICCFLFLFFRDRRRAALFALASAIFFSSFFIFVPHHWGGGYFFSTIISVLAHPTYLNLTMRRILALLRQPMFDFLVVTVATSVVYVLRKQKSALLDSPYFLYLEVAGIVPLIGLGKAGADIHYYIEFIVASSLWIVFFIRRFYSGLSPRYLHFFLLSFLVAAALEFSVTKRSAYLLTEDPHNDYHKYHISETVHSDLMELRPPNENFLVLNTHVMLPFLKHTYLNDPYNYFMMWNYGILDPQPMIAAVDKKFFSVILYALPKNPCEIPGMHPIPSGPGTDRILRSIRENYRLGKIGAFAYYVPKNQ
jgi:hypothetical protein